MADAMMLPDGRDRDAHRPRARRRHGGTRLARARRRLRRRQHCCECCRTAAASTRAASRSRSEGVNECVARGLSVIQGDADTDLRDYPDKSFDYVILSQTLQATRRPRLVLEQMLRIGRRAIVSFPNFGHWRVRVKLGLERPHAGDREPALVSWYETPNIHFCTIRDFVALVRRDRRQDRTRRGARRWRPADRFACPGGSGTCSANRRCSC